MPLLLAALIFFQPGLSEGVEAFIAISRARLAWRSALPGGGPLYRRELITLLAAQRKKSLVTGYDFILYDPGYNPRQTFRCRVGSEEGVIVEAPLSAEQIASLKGSPDGVLWRSRSMVSIEGTLRRFRVDAAPGREDLVLTLDRVTLHHLPKSD